MDRTTRCTLAVIFLLMFAWVVTSGCAQEGAAAKAVKPATVRAQATSRPATQPGKAGAATELPEAAVKAIHGIYARARFHKIEPAEREGVQVFTVYLARLMTRITVTADGDILAVGKEVELKDTPKPVAAVITRAVGESKIRITKEEIRAEVRKEGETVRIAKLDPVKVLYEVRVLRAAIPAVRKGCALLAPDGTVIKGLPAEADPEK